MADELNDAIYNQGIGVAYADRTSASKDSNRDLSTALNAHSTITTACTAVLELQRLSCHFHLKRKWLLNYFCVFACTCTVPAVELLVFKIVCQKVWKFSNERKFSEMNHGAVLSEFECIYGEMLSKIWKKSWTWSSGLYSRLYRPAI